MGRLNSEFFRDVDWFHTLLQKFNNNVSFQIVDPINYVEAYVAASLLGLGTCWGQRGYAEIIPAEFRHSYGIVQFKMYNVIVAVAHWASEWRGRTVRVHSENMAAVQMINSLCTNKLFFWGVFTQPSHDSGKPEYTSDSDTYTRCGE